jgi:hypothetical protein
MTEPSETSESMGFMRIWFGLVRRFDTQRSDEQVRQLRKIKW